MAQGLVAKAWIHWNQRATVGVVSLLPVKPLADEQILRGLGVSFRVENGLFSPTWMSKLGLVPWVCFHPRDKQALFSPIHHHFPSQSAYSGLFVQRIVFYMRFSVQLVVCFVSLNYSLGVCGLEGKENSRLATFDDITWKQTNLINDSTRQCTTFPYCARMTGSHSGVGVNFAWYTGEGDVAAIVSHLMASYPESTRDYTDCFGNLLKTLT